MGMLFLVRQAQASFLERNSEKPSALGEAQSCRLGEYWAGPQIIFDRVCAGPCVRQKDTLRLVSNAYSNASLKFPDLLVLPEFDEYQGEAVLEHSLPGLMENDQSIRALHAAFKSSSDSAGRRATFQKLFEAVIGKCVRGAIFPPGCKPGRGFASRVISAGASSPGSA